MKMLAFNQLAQLIFNFIARVGIVIYCVAYVVNAMNLGVWWIVEWNEKSPSSLVAFTLIFMLSTVLGNLLHNKIKAESEE